MSDDTLSTTIAAVLAYLEADYVHRRRAAVPEVSEESVFATDLACDAIDMVCICLEIEEAFGLNLPPDEPEHCETVGDLARLVARALQKEPV